MESFRYARLLSVFTLATLMIMPAVAQMRFAKAVAYDPGGPFADSVTNADVNGDGKMDLVVANYCQTKVSFSCVDASGEVAVLLGNGDGTFQPAATYSTGAYYAYSVAVGDMNGDGIPDVVVANLCQSVNPNGFFCVTGSPGQVNILLGKGDGTFQPAVAYSSGGLFANSVAIADLNNDGRMDIAVANGYQFDDTVGSVGVLLGNGDGTFQPTIAYSSGGYSGHGVVIGDLNDDGIPDLMVLSLCQNNQCNDSYGTVGVLLGNGDGTFRPAVTYSSGGSYGYSVAVGDLKGNGILDVVVAYQCAGNRGGFGCPTPNGVGVLLGNGDGTFQPAVNYPSVGWGIDAVAIADVNGDGHPDLVVVGECQSIGSHGGCDGTGRVNVLRGNGDGTFQPPVKYGSGGYEGSSVAIGDVNGDHRPDILVTNADGSNFSDGSVAVLMNKTSYATTTALISSPNPSQVNQTVTFTATITSNPPVPNGEFVTLSAGTTKLGKAATTNGVATLTTSFSKAMSYTIKAEYPGDAFRKASSGTVTQVVNP